MKKVFVSAILLMIFLPVIALGEEVPPLTAGQEQLMNDLAQKGLVNFTRGVNEVFVSPSFWNQMDFKLKRNFAAACAVYCANKNNTGLWVKLRDSRSGKKLGKYDSLYGLEVD